MPENNKSDTLQKVTRPMDLNVRVIKAVECCPVMYKGRASIAERQVVWQQLSEQMNVAESVLKSRWHILCGYYQRWLEKRRSTDDNNEDGSRTTARNDFKYEKEMAFMMPYMHARITIAAANAARKQQELAAAGNSEQLSDPEFVITEKDVEIANNMSNNINEEYMFYDVETLDGEVEVQQYTQEQQEEYDMKNAINDDNDDGEEVEDGCETEDFVGTNNGEDNIVIDVDNNQLQIIEEIPEDMGEVIEELDESGNIIVQSIIIESNDLISEDAEEIVVEDEEEVIQMDGEIEMQNETVIEEIVDHDTMSEIDEVHSSTPQIAEDSSGGNDENILRLATNNDREKFARMLIDEHTHVPQVVQEELQQYEPQPQHPQPHHHHHHHHQQQPISLRLSQEYALTTRRRRAVVLKATPRVQVELTDNAAASVNSILQHDETEGASLDVAANVAIVDDASSATINDNKVNQQQQQRSTPEKPILTTVHTPIRSDLVSTTADNDDAETTKNERSEDTIFGELVTAMLKHMPQDRKRAIKKKIMDLLLT